MSNDETKVLLHSWSDAGSEFKLFHAPTGPVLIEYFRGVRHHEYALNAGTFELARLAALVAEKERRIERLEKALRKSEAMVTALEFAKTGSEVNDSGTWWTWAECPVCAHEHQHKKGCALLDLQTELRELFLEDRS